MEPRSLHPNVRIVWILQSLLSAAILGVIVGAIGVAGFDLGIWVGGVAFLVVSVLTVLHAILRYRIWTYEVREDALYLERGVLTRVRTVVPYVRIQHVDASRGPVERAVGLASSVVYTAGTRGADVTIPGLTPERADDLQERLKQLAILAEGDDAV
ncbi:PH domain-containing protein [Natronoarchaeum philippinense]|uniref:PH domain-containing protein n=1 Tax=Natronoarchaeum philippinense TaxID=558529 RepID=UPI000BE3CC9D|nr:PH domain-containing protein [Natronoarchaeum philippinense]